MSETQRPGAVSGPNQDAVEGFRKGLGSPPKPPVFDGIWALRTIHRIAIELGYERTRADRGTDPKTDRYYEVGYGPMFTITLTTSLDEVLRTTRETWGAFTEEKIREVLKRNLERVA